MSTAEAFVVGGVRLPRPFRIRRLGHVGLNVGALEDNLVFYRDMLGLMVSDVMDFRTKVPDPERLAALGDTRGIFLRHGTDHHSFVLFDNAVYHGLGRSGGMGAEVSVNQITFQVGSLREVVDAAAWLERTGTPLRRSGRDVPGSNWHSYFYDPQGHIVELYYGIEQIGWDGVSKPKAVHAEEHHRAPALPQRPEYQEVDAAVAAGHGLTGYRHKESAPASHEVEGVLLPRPFKIAALGPMRLFVEDMAAAEAFWAGRMGLAVAERRALAGGEALFLRCGAEHHSLALYPLTLRRTLPVNERDTLLSVGLRLASYAQLKAARAWLAARGVKIVELPPELRPGIDRAFWARSPHGHLVELSWHMDMAGLPPCTQADDWPDAVDPPPAAYCAETLLGPWA